MIEFRYPPELTTRCPTPSARKQLESPGFGQLFTDHMITLRWTAGQRLA